MFRRKFLFPRYVSKSGLFGRLTKVVSRDLKYVKVVWVDKSRQEVDLGDG